LARHCSGEKFSNIAAWLRHQRMAARFEEFGAPLNPLSIIDLSSDEYDPASP
jgi:hypothetical protein